VLSSTSITAPAQTGAMLLRCCGADVNEDVLGLDPTLVVFWDEMWVVDTRAINIVLVFNFAQFRSIVCLDRPEEDTDSRRFLLVSFEECIV